MLWPWLPCPGWVVFGLGMSRGISAPRATTEGCMVARTAGVPGLLVLAGILPRPDLPRFRHRLSKRPCISHSCLSHCASDLAGILLRALWPVWLMPRGCAILGRVLAGILLRPRVPNLPRLATTCCSWRWSWMSRRGLAGILLRPEPLRLFQSARGVLTSRCVSHRTTMCPEVRLLSRRCRTS